MRLSAPTRARSSVFSSSVRATIVGKEQECCHRTRRRKPRIPFAVRGTDGVLPHSAPGPYRGLRRLPLPECFFSRGPASPPPFSPLRSPTRSEEHTSELQSLRHLVC